MVTALSAIKNPTPEVKELNWKDMIAKALGKDPATCSDEDLATALSAALAKPDPTALNAAIATAVETAVKPLTEKVTALSAGADTFAAELLKRDKASALSDARMEGKVVALSASVLDKMTLDDVREHVKGLAVTVPLSARTPGVVPQDPVKAGPTDEQRTIALNCGMDPDAVWPKK
jgi:hypothetical protein